MKSLNVLLESKELKELIDANLFYTISCNDSGELNLQGQKTKKSLKIVSGFLDTKHTKLKRYNSRKWSEATYFEGSLEIVITLTD